MMRKNERTGRASIGFTLPLFRKYAEPGATVIFECRPFGNPFPEVKWYKNAEEVQPIPLPLEFTDLRIDADHDGTQRLILRNVDQSCAGVYTCVAKNQHGTASTRAILSIHGEHPQPAQQPTNEGAIGEIKSCRLTLPTRNPTQQQQQRDKHDYDQSFYLPEIDDKTRKELLEKFFKDLKTKFGYKIDFTKLRYRRRRRPLAKFANHILEMLEQMLGHGMKLPRIGRDKNGQWQDVVHNGIKYTLKIRWADADAEHEAMAITDPQDAEDPNRLNIEIRVSNRFYVTAEKGLKNVGIFGAFHVLQHIAHECCHVADIIYNGAAPNYQHQHKNNRPVCCKIFVHSGIWAKLAKEFQRRTGIRITPFSCLEENYIAICAFAKHFPRLANDWLLYTSPYGHAPVFASDAAETKWLASLLAATAKREAERKRARRGKSVVSLDSGENVPKMLAGQVCIVTGANGKFGEEIVELLGTDTDANIVLASHEPILLQAHIEGMIERGIPAERLLAMKCDITSADDVARMAGRTVQHFGRIDVLINGAELIRTGNMDEWHKQIDENVQSTANVIGAILPHMIARKRGQVLTFTRNAQKQKLRMELLNSGVKFTNIQPGQDATEVAKAVIYAVSHPEQVAINLHAREMFRTMMTAAGNTILQQVFGGCSLM